MAPKHDSPMLRDPEQLAKELYEYWIETLKTDGYSDEIEDWDTVEGDVRRNFIEAVNEIVVKPLDRLVTDMEVQISILEASEALDKMAANNKGGGGGGGAVLAVGKYRCYTCSGWPVDKPGMTCHFCRAQARSS